MCEGNILVFDSTMEFLPIFRAGKRVYASRPFNNTPAPGVAVEGE
jgi:hypothetical protein